MNKALDLIDNTDRLLAEADENLKALEAMKVDSRLDVLQALVAKYKAFSQTLGQKKLELLVALIQLALTIGKDESMGRHFSTKMIGRPINSNHSSLDDFCGNIDYRAFCEGILASLGKYLRDTPETHKAERQALESLMSEYKDLFKGKAKGK